MILRIYGEPHNYKVIKKLNISHLHICTNTSILGVGSCFYPYGDDGVLMNSKGECIYV